MVRRQFKALPRRKAYLQQEMYNYARFYRDAEGPDSTKLRVAEEDNRQEFDEIDFLLTFYQENTETDEGETTARPVPHWMMILVLSIAISALVMAGVAIWK